MPRHRGHSPGTATGSAPAGENLILYQTYPGVAQLVARLLWELEHQNGSTSRNVVFSLVTPQNPAITSVESSSIMCKNFLDHIFDHNELFSLIQYPGVAQLVGRLGWELEHQNGSTSRNVAYSPLSSKISLITAVESSSKLC